MQRLILILVILLSTVCGYSQQNYTIGYKKFKESKTYVYTKQFNSFDLAYTLSKNDTRLAYLIAALRGINWAHREIYHAYPDLLQNYYNQSRLSFIGEDAWMRNYYNWDPNNKHKIEYFNSFRDIYHFTGLVNNVGACIEYPLIWNQSMPKKYKIANTIGLFLTRAAFAGLTYKFYVDNKR